MFFIVVGVALEYRLVPILFLNLIIDLLFTHFIFVISDLVHCTNEPNVSIPQLANLLVERSQNTNWTVVFKALITVHHMMCYGNEVKHLSIFLSQF